MTYGARFVFRVFGAFCAALAWFGCVWAQETPPEIATPPTALVDPDAPIPLGIVTAEPYASWSRHTGTAEEAVVLVTVRDADGKERTGTGLCIRCDGFILVPEWVRAAMIAGGKASVTVVQAEGETTAGPFPVASRTYHNNPRVRYSVVKVTGHHIPCVPLLDANNIQAGDKVRVVRAVPDGAGRCKAVSTPATIARFAPEQEVGRKDRWVLSSREASQPLKAEDAPQGALVVDEASGAVVGTLLSEGGGEPVFCSLLYLYDICGEVGLMPDRKAIEERSKQSGSLSASEFAALRAPQATAGLIWVPGGPVQLRFAVLDAYRQAYGTDVACMPGFFICANPVTNQEYRAWLLTLPAPRLPVGWQSPDEMKYPRRNPTFPAAGMLTEDALAYARARGWRLPTGVEWQRASLCKDYEWAKARTLQWQLRFDQLLLLNRGRFQFWSSMQQAAEARLKRPVKVNLLDTPEDQAFAGQMQLIATNIYRMYGEEVPWQPVRIDVRPEDISIFGVRHMVMNAPELIIPSPATGGVAAKVYPAHVDPYVSVLKFNPGPAIPLDIATRYAITADGIDTIGGGMYLLILSASSTTNGGASSILPPMHDFFGSSQRLTQPLVSMSWRSRILAGFRGAR